MENPSEPVVPLTPDIAAAKPKRDYPRWVGSVMTFFLPGSAQFLSGRRQTGILCFLLWLFLAFLPLVPAAIPGKPFFYLAALLFAVSIVYFLGLIIASWRPTRRIGISGWILFVVVVLVLPYVTALPIALLTKSFYVELFVVSGGSMAPTLIGSSESHHPEMRLPESQTADRPVVNKILYRLRDPRRGDVVVYRTTNPEDGSPAIWAHRIVGLPGETVDIAPPYVLIDGRKLVEPPIFAVIAASQEGFSGYVTAEDIAPVGTEGIELPLTLGSKEYFLLGDNSRRSLDSRFRGPVRRERILGRVIRIYYPFNRIREIE